MKHIKKCSFLYQFSQRIIFYQLCDPKKLFTTTFKPNVFLRSYSNSSKDAERREHVKKFEVGDCSRIGRRNRSEDRFTNKHLTKNTRLYGVYDGHCGSFAVNFVEKNLRNLLQTAVKSIELQMPHHLENSGLAFQRIIKESTENCFNDCETNLINAILENSNLQKRDIVGSTATVALIHNDVWLTVAHIGDSKAFLMRNDDTLQLCDDHSPNNTNEALRINDCGGWITYNTRLYPMVNGHLAMTRSFGDMALKEFGVIAQPYIRQLKLDHKTDKCLLLCTDGLTDTVNDTEICDIINRCQDPNEAAKELTSLAQQYGSTDDTTAIVVALGAWNVSRSVKINFSFSPYRTVTGARGDG